MELEFQKLFFLLIFLSYWPKQSACSPTSAKATLNKHQKLVVISFDGFRSDYMNKTETPVLDALAQGGVSVPYMRAQFTTKTFPNHQSLSTGLFTESHGIVDNSVYDPIHGYQTGFVDYNDLFWNFDERVVPIWTLNEWAGDGRVSGVQFPGANQEYGANRTLPTHYLTYNGSRPYENRMDLVHDWLTHPTKPANLVFMYFEEPDETGHAHGPESDEVKVQIRRMDKMTEYLINKLKNAGIYEEVNIILWSDHGMQEVNVGNRINVTQLVGALGVDRSYYDRYGGSPVLHILPKEGREAEVLAAFKNASVGRKFTVYSREEVPAHFQYQNNRRIMPIVVVAEPGFVFDDYKSTEFDATKKFGVHGYDNHADSMKPFFIASGPAFKKGFKAEPFDNVDLFPLIASMMNFGPSPNNGTLERVSPMLGSSTMTLNNGNRSLLYAFVGLFAFVNFNCMFK